MKATPISEREEAQAKSSTIPTRAMTTKPGISGGLSLWRSPIGVDGGAWPNLLQQPESVFVVFDPPVLKKRSSGDIWWMKCRAYEMHTGEMIWDRQIQAGDLCTDLYFNSEWTRVGNRIVNVGVNGFHTTSFMLPRGCAWYQTSPSHADKLLILSEPNSVGKHYWKVYHDSCSSRRDGSFENERVFRLLISSTRYCGTSLSAIQLLTDVNGPPPCEMQWKSVPINPSKQPSRDIYSSTISQFENFFTWKERLFVLSNAWQDVFILDDGCSCKNALPLLSFDRIQFAASLKSLRRVINNRLNDNVFLWRPCYVDNLDAVQFISTPNHTLFVVVWAEESGSVAVFYLREEIFPGPCVTKYEWKRLAVPSPVDSTYSLCPKVWVVDEYHIVVMAEARDDPGRCDYWVINSIQCVHTESLTGVSFGKGLHNRIVFMSSWPEDDLALQ